MLAPVSLHQIPLDDLRTECRRRLESCELWLRRVVHDRLHAALGESYFESGTYKGQAVFRNDIRKHAASRLGANPGRYARPVDSLQLDHLVAVLCKHGVYHEYFAAAFARAFINAEHLRLVLDRLVPIRNALSHANPVSSHDAERVFCYCDDIVSALIQYYAEAGMSNDFDAPTFVRFRDSLGHSESIQKTRDSRDYCSQTPLRVGDSLRLELEVDAHYLPSDYTIRWHDSADDRGEGTSFSLTLLPKHAGEEFHCAAILCTNKEWHRHTKYDATFTVTYRVVPA